MDQPKSPDDNQVSLPETGIRQEANNSTFGGGQQAAIGNDNIQNQGNNNWLGNTLNFFFGQQITPIGNTARPKNERILLAAVKQEVTARLRQSLHNVVLINLGKELQPHQVKPDWYFEIKSGIKPAEPLPDTTTNLEVFDLKEIAGKLLILGAPGAGKTTTQLELAQELIKRAEEQPEYPVPVLFNLSSWKDDRQSITDWLVAELKSKYGVSTKLGQEWVNNHQLLPMLDGLDELEPQRQELCVDAINQFLASETKPLYLVVCSRIEEYGNYTTQLQLNGAIYLQPLTNNQICDYLTAINCIELWLTISSDLDLLELVKTPLLLSITVLTSQEISVEEWQQLKSTADRRQYLFDAYVGRMLTRGINSRAYKNKPPNAKRTRMWLVWLAQQMQRESKTEFFIIEEIQPNYLMSKSQQKSYTWIFGLIFGLFNLLIFGLLNLLIFGLIFGLIICLIAGQAGVQSHKIKLHEKIYLRKIDKQQMIFWLLLGLLLGLMNSGYLITRLILGLFLGLFIGLFSWVIFGMIGFQSDPAIENKKFTNQGIWTSASNAVFFGSILGLISGLILGLSNGLSGGLSGGLGIGLFSWVIYGGITCLQHFTLRLILYFNGYIPWNYARFLDYCTERLFLQRVGGRYRFIHKLLQDHFAKMEFKRN
ncbi:MULTISPECIES: NACHT domain-containing protein [Nostoc]|uniref:NACHT domain-containing protein n=2 Tax=Nostoc TaxID=1177 RepID=A0ABR8II59_9NOSO|nr:MULTISPECIES: NACHT domain-containing protein [Nostoc]MBD2565627.1 NACHT domain-containing protein [Nostoc linckia FACHB-391]MBD2650160.1 NACHT domain-containing protein [Nostoc foliaceum FACHB-393]